MNYINIEEYIPKGRDNAISRGRLMTVTGYGDRQNRRFIAEARLRGVPIVSNSHGKGYFIAEKDEDVSLIVSDLKSRIGALQSQIRALERARQMEGQVTI